MTEIIPAILPKDTEDLRVKLGEIPDEIEWIHLDVLEQDIWAGEINKDFEVHLMVREPEKIIDKWVGRGAKRILSHKIIERPSKQMEVGLAAELHIPLEEIYPLIPQVDFLNLMSIAEIGAQGRPFDERIFDRIKEVKEKFPELPISVDGGINVSNYQKLLDLGVDRLVVGSGFKELWSNLQMKK